MPDATPIEAAQSGPGLGKNGEPKRDKDAGWHVKADSRGTLKSTYGLAAVAHNIQKAAKFLRLYGLPDPTRAA